MRNFFLEKANNQKLTHEILKMVGYMEPGRGNYTDESICNFRKKDYKAKYF